MTENSDRQPMSASNDTAPTPEATDTVRLPETAAKAPDAVPAVEAVPIAVAAPASGGMSGKRIALIAGGVAVAMLLAIGIFASGVAVGSRMGGRFDATGRGVPPMMSQQDLPQGQERGQQGFEGRGGRGDHGPRGFDGQRSLPDTSSALPQQ